MQIQQHKHKPRLVPHTRAMSSEPMFKFEKFDGPAVTPAMLADAAHLFSTHYGVWSDAVAAKNEDEHYRSPKPGE